MITRCDHCGCKFEVSSNLVYSADPTVRCGECMALFDARANLHDEAKLGAIAATYKPVQPKARVKPTNVSDVIDPAVLDTADTVASEHVFSSYKKTPALSTADTSAGFAQPDVDLARAEPASYPDHRARSNAMSDIEFEKTRATESSLGHAVAPSRHDAPPRRDYDNRGGRRRYDDRPPRRREGPRQITARHAPEFDPALDPDRHLRGEHHFDRVTRRDPRDDRRRHDRRAPQRGPERFESPEDITQRKRREAGERERRALDIEPSNRGLDDSKMRQLEQFKSRHRGAALGIDDRDLIAEKDISAKARDNDFIPDDILQKPAVQRDQGWRDSDLHFDANTPKFATSLDEPVARSVGERTVQRSNTNGPVNRNIDSAVPRNAVAYEPAKPATVEQYQNPAVRDTYRAEQPSHISDDIHNDFDEDIRPSTSSHTQVPDSSAQEMRRYQQHRPPVEVSELDSAMVEAPAKVKSSRAGVSPWLWLCGLIAAACLVVYGARNVIANMGLPEPVLSAFCGVTGCVPAEAKTDVSQLQTMRKRIFTHPEIDNALVISIDFVNRSAYKQQYPTVAITLLNGEGEAVAERKFGVGEYEVIESGESEFLMPDKPARIKIEVVDSGLGATDVELEFE